MQTQDVHSQQHYQQTLLGCTVATNIRVFTLLVCVTPQGMGRFLVLGMPLRGTALTVISEQDIIQHNRNCSDINVCWLDSIVKCYKTYTFRTVMFTCCACLLLALMICSTTTQVIIGDLVLFFAVCNNLYVRITYMSTFHLHYHNSHKTSIMASSSCLCSTWCHCQWLTFLQSSYWCCQCKEKKWSWGRLVPRELGLEASSYNWVPTRC